MMDRSRPITTVLLVIVVVLLGQVYYQNRRTSQLQASMDFQQRQFEQQVGKLAAERLKGHRADLMQAAQWLHQYYASDEGLRRADGLWRSDLKQPDFEAIGAWVLDVYLNARVEGKTDEQAKQLVRDAIQGSDEWRRLHATK
ncbi:MAG: hypothetical protein FJW22_05235 [Acidimicrobiia bacterium]|nr:hypothetical protein [Acidimicrobiia bacterium]